MGEILPHLVLGGCVFPYHQPQPCILHSGSRWQCNKQLASVVKPKRLHVPTVETEFENSGNNIELDENMRLLKPIVMVNSKLN